jgi:hypothetical protein
MVRYRCFPSYPSLPVFLRPFDLAPLVSNSPSNPFPSPHTGDVYPALVRFAQGEPLNATRFNVDINDPELEVGPEEGAVKARL